MCIIITQAKFVRLPFETCDYLNKTRKELLCLDTVYVLSYMLVYRAQLDKFGCPIRVKCS